MAKVISFYSYKGGSGRSLLATNLAAHMAINSREKLYLIDMDLDSAGMTFLLGKEDCFSNIDRTAYGILTGKAYYKFITEDKNRYICDELVDVSTELGIDEPGKVILFGTNPEGAQSLGADNSLIYTRNIEDFMGEADDIGLVLVDSSSGRQPAAEVCHRISDVIIYCFRLTTQFAFGTKLQLNYFIRDYIQEGLSMECFPSIVLVPMAVPEISSKNQKKYKEKMEFWNETVENIKFRNKSIHIELFSKGIPEVDSFKWKEDILLRKGKLELDEAEAVNAYKELYELIDKLPNKSSIHKDLENKHQ